MYFDKVEMRFAMGRVHTSLVLFFAMVITDPAPFTLSHGLAHLRSLMLYLPPLLVNLDQCTLSYSKTPRRYLSSCEIGPYNVQYKLRCQSCGFGIVPSY